MAAARAAPVAPVIGPSSRRPAQRALAAVLALSMASASWAQALPPAGAAAPGAVPGLVSTEAFVKPAAGDLGDSAQAARTRLLGALDRSDLAAALAARGVDVAQARERVAALSDAEARLVAAELDRLPAGAGAEILTTITFIFVLLLITDILGFTKVFPFTRSVR
jgi:hypothetical protein